MTASSRSVSGRSGCGPVPRPPSRLSMQVMVTASGVSRTAFWVTGSIEKTLMYVGSPSEPT